MNKQSIVRLAGTLALSAGVLAAVPGLVGSAGAATSEAAATSQGFVKAQQTLELQLSNRQHQLARLSADVSASKTLTTSDAAVLTGRLATETTSIDTLVVKVPTDTTYAELHVDQRAMLRDNRVYAVMTPQVFQVIEADSVGAQVTMLQGEEASLSEDVTGLVGQPGYQSAASHYRNFVARVDAASNDTADVDTVVLAQMPADFPGDTHVFVEANHKLLTAQVDVAYADYDASVIGLATGGYTGS